VAVDPLDERLSAALDGESPPEPGDTDADDTADRLRALAEARDLLAIPPPPLDDITRRRLLRAAVADAPRGKARDLRRLNQLGAAAAVLAVVVAGGLAIKALGSSSENGSKASSGKAAGDSATAATTTPGSGSQAVLLDLHDVSNPAVLKERVAAALGKTAQSGTTGDSQTPTSTAQRTAKPPESDAVARCLPTITVAKGADPARVLADATYNGTPAVVATASGTSGTAVYVVARSDCRLLTYQFLKR